MARSEKARLADGNIVEDVVTLLSSSRTPFLVSGNGDKVPISFLEGKTVGFYFYIHGLTDDSFRDLKFKSEQLRARGENFELVFVCLHLSNYKPYVEDMFNRDFIGTTLLALPFSQSSSNIKLYERLSKCSDPYGSLELVIIQPGENIAHTHAMIILREYGIGAYPFSKSIVTEIEVARLKSLTLDQLLCSATYKFLISPNGQEIPASHLAGKNILMFLTTTAFAHYDVCLDEKVIAWYNEMKHEDEAFEMIRVVFNCNLRVEVVPSCNVKMPWLEFPNDEPKAVALGEKILERVEDIYSFLPMCVTFGRDGRFITMTHLGSLIDSGKAEKCPNFFDDVHLYGEVRDYIAKSSRWSTVNEETGECYVPW